MSVLCIDNVPEGVVNSTPPLAKKVRRSAELVANGRTCCPYCRARLRFTDWQDPDQVIRLHVETECEDKGRPAPTAHLLESWPPKRRRRRPGR